MAVELLLYAAAFVVSLAGRHGQGRFASLLLGSVKPSIR